MPGVSMAGIDLSGRSLAQTVNLLENESRFAEPFQVELVDQERSFLVNISDLGITLDATTSARNAFEFGRSTPFGSFLAYHLLGRHVRHDLLPVLEFDQETTVKFLTKLKLDIDQPMIDSSIHLSGTQVDVSAGQTGRSLDIAASVQSITAHLQQGNYNAIPLVVNEQQPEIMDASAFAEIARDILKQPFSFSLPEYIADGQQNFRISPDNLAIMLTFTRELENGATVLIPQFREDLLKAFLSDIAADVNIQAENARFIFNDETGELDLLEHSVTGQELEIQSSYEAAQAALRNAGSSSDLVFNAIPPTVDDHASAEELGITELVHAENSYFYGSSAARVQNIETSAAEFHGLLVAPGETFSMANIIQEVSLDNGYTEALIIFNGRTIEGVGGGVCQVSTTLFRTAFFTGFPIVERHPHAYRVSYYEKMAGNERNSNLAGLDATVYVPLVDLKFTNDTLHWLLMETYINRSENRITWKFYSTSDSRAVEWHTTGPMNIVEPQKPLYQENPDLSTGEIKQVDWEAEGADVRVERTVYRDGEILFEDTFLTHYEPWRAVYEYGPGTEGIPSSEEGD